MRPQLAGAPLAQMHSYATIYVAVTDEEVQQHKLLLDQQLEKESARKAPRINPEERGCLEATFRSAPKSSLNAITAFRSAPQANGGLRQHCGSLRNVAEVLQTACGPLHTANRAC